MPCCVPCYAHYATSCRHRLPYHTMGYAFDNVLSWPLASHTYGAWYSMPYLVSTPYNVPSHTTTPWKHSLSTLPYNPIPDPSPDPNLTLTRIHAHQGGSHQVRDSTWGYKDCRGKARSMDRTKLASACRLLRGTACLARGGTEWT